MKKQSKNSIKLGVFVIIALALFMAGIYYIGQKRRMFNDVIRISCVFKDVSGLQPGNNVRFAGIDIGTIEDIYIVSDSSVMVSMVIDQEVKKFIKKDARAVIGSEGLMGNKIITINSGSSTKPSIENNDMINSMQPVTFDDILLRLKHTTENTANITDDLAEIMNNIREGKGTVGKLFMDTTFAETLDQTLGNLKRGTRGFEQNMNAAQNSILLRGAFKKKNRDHDRSRDKDSTKKEKRGGLFHRNK